MIRQTLFFIVCASIMAITPARANVLSFGAESVSFGIYCAADRVTEMPAEDTVSGVVNMVAEPPPFVRGTNIIPARIGIGFGVHLLVSPEFAGPITVNTTHPPMGPEGVIRQSWSTEVTEGRVALHGFTFEYDYEMVHGDWSISASQDGRLIYHADFVIVDPATTAPISCDGLMLS